MRSIFSSDIQKFANSMPYEALTGWIKSKNIRNIKDASASWSTDNVAHIGDVVDITPTSNVNTQCISIDANAGDVFTIIGRCVTNARLFGFLDTNNRLLVCSEANQKSYTGTVIVAPENTTKAFFNLGINSSTKLPNLTKHDGVYKGIYTPMLAHNYVFKNPDYIIPYLVWTQSQIDTINGITTSYHNILSNPISIHPGQELEVEIINAESKVAVYGAKYDETYAVYSSGGWRNRYTKLTFKDWTVAYYIRVSMYDRESGSNGYVTVDEADSRVSIKIKNCIKYPWKTIPNYGFNRVYSPVTSVLECTRQDIVEASGTFVSSTRTCLLKLPNIGNIEIRKIMPANGFKVFRKKGSTIEWLVNELCYYQYRYYGNTNYEYYALIQPATEDTTTLTIADAIQTISVAEFYDHPCITHDNNKSIHGKHIAVVGDSIVQGRAKKLESGLTGSVFKPFGALVAEVANDYNYGNFGIGGALLSGTSWKSVKTNCSKVKGYDVIFVVAGTNDFGGDITANTFRSDYATVINTLKTNNTEIVLCSPTWRSGAGHNSANMIITDYCDIIKELAETEGLKFIDLFALTNNAAFDSYLPDGLHPTESGHRMIADFIVDEYDRLS